MSDSLVASDTPSSANRYALRFYLSTEHECGYLNGQQSTSLFLDPALPMDREIHGALLVLGFRRSGQHLYTPHCRKCQACISVRVPVEDFTPDRTQRRLMRRNRELTAHERPARFNAEHYALYERYIRARHADGAMYPPSRNQYCSFLTLEHDWARLVEFRHGGQLVAVAAMDQLEHGLSAVYTFFDPDPSWQRHSLGSWVILWQIEHARTRGLPHVYLGYWIQQSRKMRYKQNFQPLEYLHGRHWQRSIPIQT
ncbi:arginyltransferase [Kushneria phosphatilytica]|uniref:Aspartate/glutamate leucyltransferase n=1 Tax=Kushneria phosphatilytica TaxID=657387 RepID=A0A1S1NPI4_9GAMM|nr:arginyltransferase [Kushneria phosphatilytica]OHV09938.1 arginyltransferase [Kushneria phosphatilytica]QEL11609.1 arginyltransferase [Kushneria phosphatilytica]